MGCREDVDVPGRDQVFLHRDEYLFDQVRILIGHQPKRKRFLSGLFNIRYLQGKFDVRHSSSLLQRASNTRPGSCKLLPGSQTYHFDEPESPISPVLQTSLHFIRLSDAIKAGRPPRPIYCFTLALHGLRRLRRLLPFRPIIDIPYPVYFIP